MQTLHDLTQFEKGKKKYIIFQKCVRNFRRGSESARDEGGGRILLGDNTGGGAVVLWSVKFQCVGVLMLSTYTADRVCTQITSRAKSDWAPGLLERNC
jgi:hypothetical protein